MKFWQISVIIVLIGMGAGLFVKLTEAEPNRIPTQIFRTDEWDVRIITLPDGTRCALHTGSISCDWNHK